MISDADLERALPPCMEGSRTRFTERESDVNDWTIKATEVLPPIVASTVRVQRTCC